MQKSAKCVRISQVFYVLFQPPDRTSKFMNIVTCIRQVSLPTISCTRKRPRSKHYPARTCGAVKMLKEILKVEITITAALSNNCSNPFPPLGVLRL